MAQIWYWQARNGFYADINGKRCRLGPTMEQAAVRLRDLQEEANRAKQAEARRPQTVRHHVDVFIDSKERTWKESTAKSYGIYLGRLVEMFGDSAITDLCKTDVEAWVTALQKPTTGSYRRGVTVTVAPLRLFRAFWNSLIDDGIVESKQLPIRKIKGTKSNKRGHDFLLTADDFKAMMDNITDSGFRDLVAMMYHSGCRQHQAADLLVKDVSADKQWCVIPFSRCRHNKTPGESLPCEIPLVTMGIDAAQQIILRRIHGRKPNDPIFVDDHGSPFTDSKRLSSLWRSLQDKLGWEKCCSYRLRHTHYTRMRKTGIDILHVGQAHQHRDGTMGVNHYLHDDSPNEKMAAFNPQSKLS